MASPMIRISPRTHTTLRELARDRGRTMLEIVDEAVERERRRQILAEAHDDYARLRADPAAWAAYQAEIAAWDATLADGLPPAEPAEDEA